MKYGKKYSKNIQTVIDILKDEIRGDVGSALKKMTKDYTMTWVYQTKSGELFPSTKNDLKAELEEVYPIKGREYDIKNIAEGDNVVMIELVESYPDPDTKKVYRTPPCNCVRDERRENSNRATLHRSKTFLSPSYKKTSG